MNIRIFSHFEIFCIMHKSNFFLTKTKQMCQWQFNFIKMWFHQEQVSCKFASQVNLSCFNGIQILMENMTQLLIKKMIICHHSSSFIRSNWTYHFSHTFFVSCYVVNCEYFSVFFLTPLSLNGCSRYSQVRRGDEWVVKECLSDCIIRPVLLAAPSA